MSTPESRWKGLFQVPPKPSEHKPFLQIFRNPLSGFVYRVRTGKDEGLFLSFPSSWPFTSEFLYQCCAKNSALEWSVNSLWCSQSAQEGDNWVLVTLAVTYSLLLLLFYYH